MKKVFRTNIFRYEQISQRKKIEEEVIQSNEKYRLIAENSVNLISLINLDGTFDYVSPSFEKILQYDVCSLEKTNYFQLIHPSDLITFKNDLKLFLNKDKKALRVNFDYVGKTATILMLKLL